MTTFDRKGHWQGVYTARAETEVSWFQTTPAPSLDLLRLAGADRCSAIVDIGGGASLLVDHLLAEGFRDLTVLDLSQAALDKTRARLGEAAAGVAWITATRPSGPRPKPMTSGTITQPSIS